jgi:wyosine [tRNA(Phe)-imidazoG37] synthetase (radical SAM superfamily)
MDPYHLLVGDILYGPVASRRFGKTLGINILPSGRKLCSFHCLYCQLGHGEKSSLVPTDFPSLEDIRIAWDQFVPDSHPEIGCIVVSGNGEPTLHPDFLTLVEELIKLRQKNMPKAQLICFTNGWRLRDPHVHQALGLFDECHLKLDARFRDVDLPENGFSMTDTLECARRLPNLVIQSCFVTGRLDNMDEVSLSEWQNQILSLKPKRVDLYTVSRKPTWDGVLPVKKDKLISLTKRLEACGQNARIV